MRAQVKELFSNYGEVFALWWDGCEHSPEELESAKTHAMVRKLQPQVLINNRAGLAEDIATPEQRIPPTGVVDAEGRPVVWEACITMTSHWWGYDRHETEFKSSETLIRMLVDIVSKGGNLLLNIGPKPDGTIQREFADRLRAIGRWLDSHGEAIYGTTASPFNLLPFYGRVTTKGSRLYVHIFEWPAEREVRLPGLASEVQRAWLVAKGKPAVECRREGKDWVIALPDRPPDRVVSVIGVDLDGPPQVEPLVIGPNEKQVIELPALYGQLDGPPGQRIRYETADGVIHAGNWIRAQDTIAWGFQCPKTGTYKLRLEYSVDKGEGGSECAAVVNDIELAFKTATTNGEFRTKTIGEVKLRKGDNSLVVKVVSLKSAAAMALRRAVLKPAK